MAKRIALTFSLFLSCLLLTFSSSGVSGYSVNKELPSGQTVAFSKFVNLKMKDAEKLAGKRFTLKERIVFKLLQAKLKKQAIKLSSAEKYKSSNGAKAAFVLGILSLATLIFPFASIPLAIAAIIVGQRAYKKSNFEDKKARAGVTMGILALGILIVAMMIIGIFISDGSFGIFVIS